MLQWCQSLAGRNIGHSFGQIYYPCHKWLWAEWYSQGVQWAMANMSTKIGDLMSSQMSIKLQVGRSPSVSSRAWEAISPPFKILLLEGFHIVFWISSCVNFASHEHYIEWDQVSLQECEIKWVSKI
jgi:hypothetical protein